MSIVILLLQNYNQITNNQNIENIQESYTMCLKNIIKRNKLCVIRSFVNVKKIHLNEN
jgi:hypothetical protein